MSIHEHVIVFWMYVELVAKTEIEMGLHKDFPQIEPPLSLHVQASSPHENFICSLDPYAIVNIYHIAIFWIVKVLNKLELDLNLGQARLKLESPNFYWARSSSSLKT